MNNINKPMSKMKENRITLQKNLQSYRFEIITLFIYIGTLIVILYYHEPWFDEAQAWLIARDATLTELVGSITHYEGHPPLWHLLLMPVAKLGVPFEIGLKTVNLSLMATAMGIFIFKAPFHRIIRCTVPFTYFFFYQYGVISRTYSLLMLGFVLSALMYKERNQKPFLFVAALSIMCGASAYGMLFAAGISIVWLWELVSQPLTLDKIKSFFKSRNFYALMILLLFNILLLLCIYPYPDTYAINCENDSSIVTLFYLLFIAPADATCTFGYYGNDFQIVLSIIISILIIIILIKITGKVKQRLLLLVPYLLFVIFGSIVYFSVHHVGIITMFYLFLLWCCTAGNKNSLEDKKKVHEVKIYLFGYLFTFFMIGTSIVWSLYAAVNDISLNYGTGREIAKFITNNNLDQKNILTAWHIITNPELSKQYQDYNHMEGATTLAYFNNNIFYNYNNKSNNHCYLLHKINMAGTGTNQLIDEIYPDILLGKDTLVYTFGHKVNMNDFVIVKVIQGYTIWKTKTFKNANYIYISKVLLKQYPSFVPINIEKLNIISH